MPQGSPGGSLSPGHRAQCAELLGCPAVLIGFGTSLSMGILLLISAFLIPKSNVRWVKYRCDYSEAFSRVEESEELMHFSKARMKTWLKCFAEIFLADHYSHLRTPSILLPRWVLAASAGVLCLSFLRSVLRSLHLAVSLCGSAVKQFVPLHFPV